MGLAVKGLANTLLRYLTGLPKEPAGPKIATRGTTLFDADGRATYELVKNGRERGIKCLCCGLTSWHPDDVSHRYCGACCAFHSEQTRP